MKYTDEQCSDAFKLARKDNKKFVARGEVAWEEYCGPDDINAPENRHRKTMRRKKPSRIYYSNVSTLHPNIFFKTPTVQFSRRFKALNDPISRRACEIGEMLCEYNLEIQDFSDECDSSTIDYLVASRGVLWNTIYPEYRVEPVQVEFIDEIDAYAYNDGESFIKVKDSEVYVDEDDGLEYIDLQVASHVKVVAEHVQWRDFMHTPAKKWSDVRAVYRARYLTKEDYIKEFGKKALEEVSFDYMNDSHKDSADKIRTETNEGELALIWEKWHKPTKYIYYLSDHTGKVVGKKKPTIDFQGFFPCAKPLLGICNEDSLLPYPDYFFIRLQLNDAHEISRKKSEFRDMLKITGVCNSQFSAEINKVKTAENGKYVAVDKWGVLTTKGGVAGNVENMNVDDIVNAMARFELETESVKREIFEVTGISDLDRGITDPRETLGAQGMKNDKSSLRLGKRRQKLNRWLEKTMRLNAEAMLELAPLEQIKQVAGINLDDPIDEKALELLKDDKLRTFKITIDIDSMLQPEDEKKKQGKLEFLNVFNQTVDRFLTTKANAPEFLEMISTVMLSVLREFNSGREVEDVIEASVMETVNTVKEKLKNPPPPPPPDPAIVLQEKMVALQEQMNAVTARNKELEGQIKLRDSETKAFEAETKRMKTLSDIEKNEADTAVDVAGLDIKQMDTAVKMMDNKNANTTKIQGGNMS